MNYDELHKNESTPVQAGVDLSSLIAATLPPTCASSPSAVDAPIVESAAALLPSFKLYWNEAEQLYTLHDPRVITPEGEIVATEPSQEYTAGSWYCKIVKANDTYTATITDDTSDTQNDPQYILIFDIDDDLNVTQHHVGTIVVGSKDGVASLKGDASESAKATGDVEIEGSAAGLSVKTSAATSGDPPHPAKAVIDIIGRPQSTSWRCRTLKYTVNGQEQTVYILASGDVQIPSAPTLPTIEGDTHSDLVATFNQQANKWVLDFADRKNAGDYSPKFHALTFGDPNNGGASILVFSSDAIAIPKLIGSTTIQMTETSTGSNVFKVAVPHTGFDVGSAGLIASVNNEKVKFAITGSPNNVTWQSRTLTIKNGSSTSTVYFLGTSNATIQIPSAPTLPTIEGDTHSDLVATFNQQANKWVLDFADRKNAGDYSPKFHALTFGDPNNGGASILVFSSDELEIVQQRIVAGPGISVTSDGETVTISATGSGAQTTGFTGTRNVLLDSDYDMATKTLRKRFATEVWENGLLKSSTSNAWQVYHQAVEENLT